ncbi:MAG: DUF3987 domain-containing protein [Mycobacterium sp.]|nr:DUF3987 domain-containing protein [Mycobacterium sp.]
MNSTRQTGTATLIEADRTERLTEWLSAAPDPNDHDAVREYLHVGAELGLALLFIIPGTKIPFDGRTSQQRTKDDKAARDLAKAEGRKAWAKAKSPAGLALATADKRLLDSYLTAYTSHFGPDAPVNLAVEVGGSGLVVADADTAEQVAAFTTDTTDGPTVRTPGQKSPDGTMVHRDGGHFWFTVPDGVELPANPGTLTDETGGYSVLWDRRYVLVPPSVRAEGPYVATGAVQRLPDGLRDRIATYGAERAQRAVRARQRRPGGVSGPVAEREALMSWAQILDGTGWMSTGKGDSCGCVIWTAPGPHASLKSATAHEPGCAVWVDSPDPPLRIWTDHDIEPFADVVADRGPTVTRLRAYAAIHHNNDIGAAMTALDLHDELSTFGTRSFPGGGADGGGLVVDQLPESFWTAHPTLTRIRDAAHCRVDSAPAVLGAVLAVLAANLEPTVTVDTGIKRPMPLNMFVGLVGSAGTGKTSAYGAARQLICVAIGPEDYKPPPVEISPTTGPGVLDAFMGTVIDPMNPKVKIRQQVHDKLLLHSDEGGGLVSSILDTKNSALRLGPVLRAAWSGAPLSDGNASAERKRHVENYSVGMCVGFQLEALAELSTPEQLELGTPQRFLYVSAADPSIPETAPKDPGRVKLVLPSRPLWYCPELQEQVRRDALARIRGEVVVEPMQAHRPAMLARLAALLVVLCDPGRQMIEQADVELAETLLDVSTAMHQRAVEHRRERESAEQERRTSARISEAVATKAAVDDVDVKLAGLGQRVLKYLKDAPGTGVCWRGKDGLRQRFRSAERPLADTALDRLADQGEVVLDGDDVRLP